MTEQNSAHKGIDWAKWRKMWPVAMMLTVSFSIGNFVLTEIWAIISGDEELPILTWVIAIAMVLITSGFIALAAVILSDIKISDKK